MLFRSLKEDPCNQNIVLTRIFGLGGKDFYPDDAKAFFDIALQTLEKGFAEKPFDYFGHVPGNSEHRWEQVMKPMHGDEFKSGLIQTRGKNKRVPLEEWLKYMGKAKHLLKEENRELLAAFEQEVERRWRRLKAMHEHPYL